MVIEQHGLEKEKRLIELLGYSLIGPDGSNRWFILDENKNRVGYVQYKKLHNANVKKGYVKIFGYYTIINSSNITCEFKRELNDKNGNIIKSIDYDYSFKIKRNNHDVDCVSIRIGNSPLLTVCSEKYGFIKFKINHEGLYLNYKSSTDKFNIEEILVYKNNADIRRGNKEYLYQLRYCKKPLELCDYKPKGRITREISGIYRPYENSENELELSEKIWVYGNLRINRKNNVEGTVEEMAIKHQMGIDCFSYFRFLINQIIPLKKDIISEIVGNDAIEENGLSVFFTDYEKQNSEVQPPKVLSKRKKD